MPSWCVFGASSTSAHPGVPRRLSRLGGQGGHQGNLCVHKLLQVLRRSVQTQEQLLEKVATDSASSENSLHRQLLHRTHALGMSGTSFRCRAEAPPTACEHPAHRHDCHHISSQKVRRPRVNEYLQGYNLTTEFTEHKNSQVLD